MADHVDITLWIDRRWKEAIEKHLKGETLFNALKNLLSMLKMPIMLSYILWCSLFCSLFFS